MAAGQQNKRLNASSAVSENLQQYNAKKKKYVESSQILLGMGGHISLMWDDNTEKVVAKREQIGITWTDMSPYIDTGAKRYTSLADVMDIPQEIFGLEDVAEVLSYDVWKTCLSVAERNFLSQFLPEGTDAELSVQGLLSGENLHFGNPFLKWGASLCSGNLHPDVIQDRKLCITASKKAYYSELQKHHNVVLENLLEWKERWRNCNDPENDCDQNISFSKKHVGDKFSSLVNVSKPSNKVKKFATTAEPFGEFAVLKVCNGNKQSTCTKAGRVTNDRKGFVKVLKDKPGNSSSTSERSKGEKRFKKEDKLQRLYARPGDATKYMSYIKISKKQYDIVKEIKHSGDDGVQLKSLNHVLGNIENFQVQPYEKIEEAERKRFHEHWLRITTKDLPLAFVDWTERKLLRQQWRRSLEEDLSKKTKDFVSEEEKNERPDSLLEEDEDHEVIVSGQNCGDEEAFDPQYVQNQSLERLPSLNGPSELCDMSRDDTEDTNQKIINPENAVETGAPTHYSEGFVTDYTNSRPLQRIPSLSGDQEIEHMKMEGPEGSLNILHIGAAPVPTEVIGLMNSAEDVLSQGMPISSSKDVWSTVGMLDNYNQPRSLSHEYTPADLSLRQPNHLRGPPAAFIDLESDTFQRNAANTLFQRPSDEIIPPFDMDSGGYVLGSYENHDSGDLLQPFLKGMGTPSYFSHEPRQPEIQFLAPRDGLLQTANHHPVHFQEQQQQQLMEQRQHMRDRDTYMHQVIQNNVYTNNVCHSHLNQGVSPPVDLQNWTVNPVHVSTPLQSPSNGAEFIDKNWLFGEHGARGGWSSANSSSIPGQSSMGNRVVADQSLYSIVSQGNKLQSHSYDSVSSSGPYIPTRNFMGESNPGSSNFSQQTVHQLNYLSGHDAMGTASAAPTLRANNMPWMMNPQLQNSGLHDSLRKTFLRSWNS